MSIFALNNSKSMELQLKLEILEYSYWEHFKFAKDLSLILPLGHPKRVKLQKDMDEILPRINEIKRELNGK